MNQTFRVDIDLHGNGRAREGCDLADFLDTLADYGSPRIVSYDAERHANGGGPTMILEFTSYEDAVEFAMDWFGESDEDVKQYVQTISQHTP